MFAWDEDKNFANQLKHGVSFQDAKSAFFDLQRLIIEDTAHSFNEQRYFCLGKVDDEVLTVRFTYRNGIIRIIGAGYWRKGKKRYEEENQLQ
ncbi:MAG: BrnT family toxin [Chloroflexota bacterium]